MFINPIISRTNVQFPTNKRGVFVNDMDDLRPNKIVGATMQGEIDNRDVQEVYDRWVSVR